MNALPKLLIITIVTFFATMLPARALDIIVAFDPSIEGSVDPCNPDPNIDGEDPLPTCGHNADFDRIVEAAAAHWESIIRDDHTLLLRYTWLEAGLPDGNVELVDALGRPTAGRIRIPADRQFFYDPTPDLDEEYPMRPKMVRTMDPTERAEAITGMPVEIFEVAYNGMRTNLDGDLLTWVMHEVSHVLGLANNVTTSEPNVSCSLASPFFDVPSTIAGPGVSLRAFTENDGSVDCGHLDLGGVKGCRPDDMQDVANTSTDPSTTPGIALHECFEHQALLWIGALPSRRVRPSFADIAAVATAGGWSDIRLPRSYLRESGFFDVTSTWIGNRVPGPNDPAFVVRQETGSQVSRLRVRQNQAIDSLYVGDSNRVVVQDGRLAVRTNTTIGGPESKTGPLRPDPSALDGAPDGVFGAPVEESMVVVRNGGTFVSDEGLVEADARLAMRGGLARFAHLDNLGTLNGRGTIEIAQRFRFRGIDHCEWRNASSRRRRSTSRWARERTTSYRS